jgi:hypothetical protein
MKKIITYELILVLIKTKEVLVDIKGKIIAQSFKRHELIVPKKG